MDDLGLLRVQFSLTVLLSCMFTLSPGSEMNFVTCGSVVKLLNVKHNVRLHSHDVRYGSGEWLPFINAARPICMDDIEYNLTTDTYIILGSYNSSISAFYNVTFRKLTVLKFDIRNLTLKVCFFPFLMMKGKT